MGKHFFESLEIKNFRGVSEGEIKNFSRINLFVGGNGCGKTTVLESLFLLAGISSPDLMITTQNIRGTALSEPEDIRDFFFELNEAKGFFLKGVTKSEERELKVKPSYSSSYAGQSVARSSVSANVGDKSLSGLQYEFSVTDLKSRETGTYSSATVAEKFEHPSPAQFRQTVDERYKEELNAKFLPATENISYIPSSVVNEMLGQKQKEVLLESLRIVEPEILDIRVGLTGRISVDIGYDRFFPINFAGDGLRNILNAVSAIHSMESGIVMIDGIEAGLHVSHGKGLWKILMELSRRYDAQIFMTTHSKDIIEGLVALYKEEKTLFSEDDNAVSCFYLYKNKERRVKGYRYSPEQLRQALQSDTDIRHVR